MNDTILLTEVFIKGEETRRYIPLEEYVQLQQEIDRLKTLLFHFTGEME